LSHAVLIVKLPPILTRTLERRHGGVVLFVALFVGVAFLLRVALLLKARWLVSIDASLLAAFGWGLVFDLGAALLWSLPLIVLLTILPQRFFRWRIGRGLAYAGFFAVLYVLLFGTVAEWLFWDEYGVRFNFIAVDYLVYTKEVIGNIRESYPLPAIFAGLFVATAVGFAGLLRTGWIGRWLESEHEPFWPRLRAGGAGLAVVAIAMVGLEARQLPAFANNYNRELAKDGVWSLFAAFRDNELDYDQFYPTLPVDEAFHRVRQELAEHGGREATSASVANSPAPRDTLHFVSNDGPELHPNVIQITVESLSADFVSVFNRASHLTPNLQALAEKSLVFDNLYATGTRTDRGMEALTLALPPTPGRSLIKRPRNEHLFTLGSVFRSRGYDTAFLYGGFGYFDNMNYFFGNNGYRVIDRAAVGREDVTFANVWGACDEDLYRWTMREADREHAAGKPFHFFVMTTSNHRPYTYPEGRIDLPPKISGRAGAVKYTDFAIGQFLREAETKPWFQNTVFVIVADHCASVAGRTTLPVENYHIPLFIYAPGGQIAPGHVRELMSQVDYAPTLLGLLNWSYASRFFGWDVRKAGGDRRALIGNYQKLGLYEPGVLSMLMPVRESAEFDYDDTTHALKHRPAAFTSEAIAYYQTASYLYQHGLYRELSAGEQADYRRGALFTQPSEAVAAAQ